MLTEEQAHLHAVPAEPYTVAFGETRSVSWSSTVAFRGARYSVPHAHRDTRVWVRVAGDQVVIVADGPDGAVEIARHDRQPAGGASIDDAHYPPRRDPLDRQPQATNPDEAAFLAIGAGARAWLIEATAVGARQIPARMAEAVGAAHLVETAKVDEALGLAAMTGRFAPGDLESILAARRDEPRRADEVHSLQPGTARWARLGTTNPDHGDHGDHGDDDELEGADR
jgi:Mu transposase, C-terminal domain